MEQAKLQISALNVMAINGSRHIYVNQQKALLEKHQTGGKQFGSGLLGSDLDLNCLQRLSADDTSRHSHFVLSAGSTHPTITENC